MSFEEFNDFYKKNEEMFNDQKDNETIDRWTSLMFSEDLEE